MLVLRMFVYFISGGSLTRRLISRYRDPHPYPHLNQDCPGIGRLGSPGSVAAERRANMLTTGSPASRWTTEKLPHLPWQDILPIVAIVCGLTGFVLGFGGILGWW